MVTNIPHVVSIFIAPNEGLEMQQVVYVTALAGKGLEGDRYAEGKGVWSKTRPKIRHVSLIAQEAIQAANSEALESFSAEDTRRNIVTQGVDLNSLVGRTFWVGGVEMRGTELCHPCERPSKLSDKEGFKDAFVNRGGLRAEIMNDGEIKIGDPIVVLVPHG